MLDRNISLHKGHGAYFVVNPNHMSSTNAKLVVGFEGRTLKEVINWIDTLPNWWKVDVVSDDEIRAHAKNFPPKVEVVNDDEIQAQAEVFPPKK